MERLYDIWKGFFGRFSDVRAAIEPYAKRSGIDIETALSLILLYDFAELSDLINEASKEKLIIKGLAEYNGDRLLVSSKGAILAKSYILALSK